MTVGRSSVSNTTKLSVKRYVSVDPLGIGAVDRTPQGKTRCLRSLWRDICYGAINMRTGKADSP